MCPKVTECSRTVCCQYSINRERKSGTDSISITSQPRQDYANITVSIKTMYSNLFQCTVTSFSVQCTSTSFSVQCTVTSLSVQCTVTSFSVQCTITSLTRGILRFLSLLVSLEGWVLRDTALPHKL